MAANPTSTSRPSTRTCTNERMRAGPQRPVDGALRPGLDPGDEVADGAHDDALLGQIRGIHEALVLRRDVGEVGAVDAPGDPRCDAVHHLELQRGQAVGRSQRRVQGVELGRGEVSGPQLVDQGLRLAVVDEPLALGEDPVPERAVVVPGAGGGPGPDGEQLVVVAAVAGVAGGDVQADHQGEVVRALAHAVGQGEGPVALALGPGLHARRPQLQRGDHQEPGDECAQRGQEGAEPAADAGSTTAHVSTRGSRS